VPAYAAFLLKKKLGIKVLFDMRGFWADERLEGNIWRWNNPLHRSIYSHLKKKEKKWWYDADHMVSLTEKGKEIICANQSAGLKEKITVIPCCADENLFTTEIKEELKQGIKNDLSLGPSEKLLIYVGSLGTWYLGREMMAQFANLFERKLLDRFLWITKDPEEEIRTLASHFNLPKSSIVVKSASRDEVPGYLSIADLGIFYIRPTFSKGASSPTKLGEMLLCGLPVITNAGVGDLNGFFNENDVGYVHEIDKEKSTFIKDETIRILLTKSKQEIRKVGLANLSLSIATKRYLEIYNTLK
jgi:glycosyltransferase involved in cell wall biosynthesis